MSNLHRHQFLTSSARSLAVSAAAGPILLAQDPPTPLPQIPATPATVPAARPEPYSPETLFLTWQRDPTTTMTIQWIGSDWEFSAREVSYSALTPEVLKAREAAAARANDPKAKDAKIPAGPTIDWLAAPIRSRPFPMTDLRVYRAELTNLTPGTEYAFKIGSTSPESRFRTMPARATEAFQFISGGDCGVNTHALANNTLAAKQDPYFVLIGGDLGYDNGRSPRTAIQFIKNYAKTMTDSKGRLIPLVTCIGNHEVNGGYGKTRADAPFYFALFDGLFANTTYATLDFGDYLSLVLLDSGHVSPVGGDQTDWLDRTLKARALCPHLFVANHVPAYPSFREPVGQDKKLGTGEEQRKFWVPLFEKHAVDIVLEHHDHTFKRTHPLLDGLRNERGILYLGDGSWGQLRVPKTPEKRPYLAAVGGAYHFTIHKLEGDQRFHVALEEGGKILDITSSRRKSRNF